MSSSIVSEQLSEYLEDLSAAEGWLRQLGLTDIPRAHGCLVRIAQDGLPLDVVANLCQSLTDILPVLSDPDMALGNLENYLRAARNPLSLAALFERDAEALPILLQMLSTSQHLSDLLTQEPDIYDSLRITEGTPVSREILAEELSNEIRAAPNEQAVQRLLRSYKRRETARIMYGDIVRAQRIEIVTRQISYLADCLTDAAVFAARLLMQGKYGQVVNEAGTPSRFVVLGMGKLGGLELNYSSDIDLIFLFEGQGKTDGAKSVSSEEYYGKLSQLVTRLLSESTDRGFCYRVDLRLRPNGEQGPITLSRQAALRYYENQGRTWERQAFVKARPIAGDLSLGREFLDEISSWIYRRYLSRADITGIKALKRRIERSADDRGERLVNVKNGQGGIRDIEFTIQFLQLLNGAELADLRTTNTLEAISRLQQTGCLTMQESAILEENYAFLRRVEHRLQIMFDLQTHSLPERKSELRKLAIRMGFEDQTCQEADQWFTAQHRERCNTNRKILNHLLHDAFEDGPAVDPEADLILDPAPTSETIDRVLAPYGLRDTATAYRHLCELADEKLPFLSTRRCRHFLAAIVRRLLTEIASTPNPDAALISLGQVSDSLGGKGVLWELFSESPAALRLYVRLCAGSPYLASILISNPGMIDELLDSLLLDRLPNREEIFTQLEDRCRNAEDIVPILHSFKNSMHLMVGVREIMGKDDVRRTTRTLSDIAEACLGTIAARETVRLRERWGCPSGELVILGMGKLGGREPNYHSDLDVIFLFDRNGRTRVPRDAAGEATTNQHYFSTLAQRIIQAVTRLSPLGRLFEMDPRLRPTGQNGSLAISFGEFHRYFHSGQGQLWERQALCKARPIFGSAASRLAAMQLVRTAVTEPAWREEFANEIADMRQRMQATASERNLKRGPGGNVDIEFAVQMLQLRHIGKHPDVMVPGTLDAIEALEQCDALSGDDAAFLAESYRFLRMVESRLRLMNTVARHDLPQDEESLARLAYLLDQNGGDALLRLCSRYTEANRRLFERIFRISFDG